MIYTVIWRYPKKTEFDRPHKTISSKIKCLHQKKYFLPICLFHDVPVLTVSLSEFLIKKNFTVLCHI